MAFQSIGQGTLLSPASLAMVSCSDGLARPNIITVAWLGTVNSDPPMLSVSIKPSRFSYDIIDRTNEFVVNLVNRDLIRAADLCGVRSGRDLDKFELCGLQALPALGMAAAPCIAQSPLYLSCKVSQKIVLGSHTMFIADIVAVAAQDDLLDQKGKLDLAKTELVAYSHGEYAALQRPEGFFGFSIARPEVLSRRMRKP